MISKSLAQFSLQGGKLYNTCEIPKSLLRAGLPERMTN